MTIKRGYDVTKDEREIARIQRKSDALLSTLEFMLESASKVLMSKDVTVKGTRKSSKVRTYDSVSMLKVELVGLIPFSRNSIIERPMNDEVRVDVGGLGLSVIYQTEGSNTISVKSTEIYVSDQNAFPKISFLGYLKK